MKILKPGQTVVLNEGKPGEPSTRVEGKIAAAHIYADMSVQYKVMWWNDRTMNDGWFTPEQLIELSDAEYFSIEAIA